MNEYSTIRINKGLASKLKLVKGENNLNYDEIIEKLLQQSGGVIVDDVITIQREQVAFSLKYWNDDSDSSIVDVSYYDLSMSDVGDIFIAEVEPKGKVFVNSVATVLFKSGSDVILSVEEISRNNDEVDKIKSIVHVYLF